MTPFAAALDQAADAVLITDADLAAPGPTIVYANQAFARLSGYSPEELIGQSPRILQGPATQRPVLDELRRSLSAGRSFEGRATNYRKDGTPFEIAWRVSPVRAVDGRITHYLSTHRDVTRQATFDRIIGDYVAELLTQSLDEAGRSVRLMTLAMTDGLTGLYNHRYFHEAISRVTAAETRTSLLMADVDGFKQFNDTYGHPAGDELLAAFAGAIKSSVGEQGVVARYGGEEFAVILPGLDEDHALSVAEDVRAAIEAVDLNGRKTTISIGVATATKGDAETTRTLIEQADEALYVAKTRGRNQVRHHRHATQKAGHQCAPTPDGCLRCETVDGVGTTRRQAALVLGPQDADAAATLSAALTGIDFDVNVVGPTVVVRNVGRRLPELGALLRDRLNPYTRACVRAAYAPGGAETAEQALSAFLFSERLSKMLDRVEHEWVRDALNDGWLFSVFHPIVDVRTGRPFAQEALLRAKDPTDGKIIGAGPIIKACESLNLQHQLDQRARQTAIRAAASHVPAPAKIFINFLPNTIYDPEICLRTTMQAADASNVEVSRLVFEVVETENIPDMDRLRHILDYYRARGVGTAVDDMGAGFTSVQYVEALRPDYVKLDRELVVDAETSAEARAKIAEVVDACKRLGARVIAEGIETPAQMNQCIAAGVDYLQGFLFARPAVPPQVAAWPSLAMAA